VSMDWTVGWYPRLDHMEEVREETALSPLKTSYGSSTLATPFGCICFTETAPSKERHTPGDGMSKEWHNLEIQHEVDQVVRGDVDSCEPRGGNVPPLESDQVGKDQKSGVRDYADQARRTVSEHLS
ncbi:hypothetical protein BD311DRAFT_679494, partial [Dichomitus squalens]